MGDSIEETMKGDLIGEIMRGEFIMETMRDLIGETSKE